MSETVNQFKNRLDKFWSNQDIIYSYKAELTGVGNRSSTIIIVSIFTYLSVLYDVDIEASACVLSSRYAMLCYACNNYATCDVHSTTPSSHWCMYLSPVALTTVSVSVYWLYTKADDTICNMSSVLLHESY